MKVFAMKASIIVLLVLSQGEAQDEGMVAMTRAAERALGTDSRIFVHEPTGTLSDDDAVSLGQQVRASAVVEVRWGGPDRTVAHLHVHLAEGAGWFDRDLTFAQSAPYAERGRTLGLQIATMVPDTPLAEAPRPAPQVPAPPVETPPPVAPIVDEGAAPRAWAFDLAAIGSAGGSAEGVGAALGLRYGVAPRLAIRAAAGWRSGEIASASASSRALYGSLGVFVGAFPDPRTWTLGLRADLMVLHHALSRADQNGVDIRSAARALPGADLLAELGLAAGSRTRVVVALGAEYAFGTTEVYVGQDRVATIRRLRAVGEVGMRIAF
jgi:hypothetical protein